MMLTDEELASLDVSKLNPLSPEIMTNQATINFGTIGHVAHGKSTVVRAISGVQTVRFKHEKERNITIKLGYANAKIFKCTNPDCPPPSCYVSTGSAQKKTLYCQNENCNHPMELLRHVSFVDCPGHDILMATMLNGAAVMDAALLLIAGNEQCPQPQTSEHLAAVEIMRLKHIIILQNKVELIKSGQANLQYEEIRKFVSGTAASDSEIIPISAVLKFNIDVLCQYICTQVPVPKRDLHIHPQMIVIRSFDVNKPGEVVENLRGGVAGGTISRGVLKVGDDIEVRPGFVSKDQNGKIQCRPVMSKVISMFSEKNDLQFAIPGGLIGVGTKIDSTLTRADRLVGQVLGHPGELPGCYTEITIKFYLLRRLLGIRNQEGTKRTKVSSLRRGEFLMFNIGSTSVGGRVVDVTAAVSEVDLNGPVCLMIGDKIAMSRRVDKHWRLIGWGEITNGKEIALQEPL